MAKYSIDEEYIADYMFRRAAWMIAAVIVLVLAAVGYSCIYGPILRDDMMRDEDESVYKAVMIYYAMDKQWPESLEQVREDPDSLYPWPVNPYNHKPIADTGSPDFNRATSVGMVHYVPVMKDGKQVGFKLHVFGRTGEIDVLFGP